MLRAKRRRTRMHNKKGNPIFNTMNSTPLQSTYKNQNTHLKQLTECQCKVCRDGGCNGNCSFCGCSNCKPYNDNPNSRKCCKGAPQRNPALGYRRQLVFNDIIRNKKNPHLKCVEESGEKVVTITTNNIYKDNYARICGSFRKGLEIENDGNTVEELGRYNKDGELIPQKWEKTCGYRQTKSRIQNRDGWMNDKYNYSTKQYLERRCRSFKNQSFNFLSNQAIADSSGSEFLTGCQVSNIFLEQGSASLGCTAHKEFLIISGDDETSLNGKYELLHNTSTIAYKQENGYYIGLYSGSIGISPWPTSLFWGFHTIPPSDNVCAQYYLMGQQYGTLLGENNFNLKHDEIILAIGETGGTPSAPVTEKVLTLSYKKGDDILHCKYILGIDCSKNKIECPQTTDKCAKKGYSLCEATNNNCKAVYKRSNPRFSMQGAVSGGSRINRLKYQTQLKAQSLRRPTRFFPGGLPGTATAKPYTTAANNNMTYRGTPYEKVNTTSGVNAINGTYPVSLYRNTYPQYKANLSGLCLGNMGLTLNDRPQRCKMPPEPPACKALQTLPERCHFRCSPAVHNNCRVEKKR